MAITLLADIDAVESNILVTDDDAGDHRYPFPARIESEQVNVMGCAFVSVASGGTYHMAIERGAAGTTPASHGAGATLDAVSGFGDIQSVTIDLSTADLATVDDDRPVIVPAPGAGKAIIVESAIFQQIAGPAGVPFGTGPELDLMWGNVIAAETNPTLNVSVDSVVAVAALSGFYGGGGDVGQSNIDNVALTLGAGND